MNAKEKNQKILPKTTIDVNIILTEDPLTSHEDKLKK